MTETTTGPSPYRPDLEQVTKALAKRSFCNLATVSANGRPHVAGILYQAIGTTFYLNTARRSRKARNVADNPHVAVVVPIRRVPVGGAPSTVQFQGDAEILALDDPEIMRLVEAGRLKNITSHGELEHPDGCFLKITPRRRLTTYGLGMSLVKLIREPLQGGGIVELPATGSGATVSVTRGVR